MAKRNKRIYENPPANSSLEDLSIWMHDQMSQNQDQSVLMLTLFCLGVEPEKYRTFYDVLIKTPAGQLLKTHPEVAELLAGIGSKDPVSMWDNPEISSEKKAIAIPMKDGDKKSLLLKLQLEGITKPPIWREVLVPASYTFSQLHDIIQIVFNWDDSHLWQFEEKAYNSDYVIKLPYDEDFDMRHSTSYDAETTQISAFLKNKESKMEYLYDFGDDWVVKISMKEIVEKKKLYAELLKFKGDNMVDDIGGPWGYLRYRDFYQNINNVSKKEINEFLETTWFDSKEKFIDFMKGLSPDIDNINECLKDIG